MNTIAHTVGAIGVGSQAALIFGETEFHFFGLSLISLEAFISGAMTLAILIFSEVIPKTLGANNWESLTPFAIPAIWCLLFVLAPFVWISQFITRNLKKEKDRPVLSRRDFAALTELGKEDGVLAENERKIIQNLLQFRTISAKNVMTPYIVIKSADETMTIRDFHQSNMDLPFSRIPVYKFHGDNINGYVLKDDLLLRLVDNNGIEPLSEIKRDILVVLSSIPIPDFLDTLILKREHISLVMDEFGGIEGIVTMEDIIETLLGLEIVDESDAAVDMQALARENWRKRARQLGIISSCDIDINNKNT